MPVHTSMTTVCKNHLLEPIHLIWVLLIGQDKCPIAKSVCNLDKHPSFVVVIGCYITDYIAMVKKPTLY